jgi:hypothetical protein
MRIDGRTDRHGEAFAAFTCERALKRRQTSILRVEFEYTVLVFERSETAHSSDRAVTNSAVTRNINDDKLGEVSGSDGDECEDGRLVGCCAVQSGRN